MTNNSEELRTRMINYGIDLGTTTSIISHCQGNDTPIIPNLISGRNYTPSAVAIDEEGHIDVGESAKRLSLSDESNAFAEFKINMGMDKKYHFEDADVDMFPEELSAEVLKELKNSVLDQIGQEITSAVITVPADFGLIKVNATRKAAELAGFKYTPIIMEPVAAAYAYSNYLNENGTWMIYDLGGGTFDVSIVKLEKEEFKNLSHSGDERLGGNLIDWDIVEKIFASKIRDDLGIEDFYRKEAKYKKVFAKLKGAAEEGKKYLSNADKAKIFVDNLLVHDDENYDFKYTLTRDEVEEIMIPYINRTINHCNDALKKARLTTDKIDYIMLVGGSTLSPIVREKIEETFNIPLKYDIDPVTVVAKGAALYAGTRPDPTFEVKTDNFGLHLDYKGIGPIRENFIVKGKVLSNKVETFEGFEIKAINVKTKRSTGKISVEADGSFLLNLYPEDEINKYSLKVYDSTGALVEIDEDSANSIEYKVGHDQIIILPHTLGLGLADDSLFVLAKEGSVLPYQTMDVFKTTSKVTAGDEDSYISIPLYNGTANRASNNLLVGELLIGGEKVKKSISENSELTITVKIDSSRDMKFDVFILDTGERFEFKILEYDTLDDPEIIKKKFKDIINKYELIKSKCNNMDVNDKIDAYLAQIKEENLIGNISDFIERSENDEDAIYQADKLIKKFNEILNNIESYFGQKDKIRTIKYFRKYVKCIVDEKGNYEHKEKFKRISDQLDEAIDNKDYLRVDKLENALREVKDDLMDPCEQNKIALNSLIAYGNYNDEDEELVNELKEEGRNAIENNNCSRIYDIAVQLDNLRIKDDMDDEEEETFYENRVQKN
ncbi:MAG: Hsp70 family protein [Methanosphaera sp.]|nr:Hsp70 family protein [Methanosphaera sp.]